MQNILKGHAAKRDIYSVPNGVYKTGKRQNPPTDWPICGVCLQDNLMVNTVSNSISVSNSFCIFLNVGSPHVAILVTATKS